MATETETLFLPLIGHSLGGHIVNTNRGVGIFVSAILFFDPPCTLRFFWLRLQVLLCWLCGISNTLPITEARLEGIFRLQFHSRDLVRIGDVAPYFDVRFALPSIMHKLGIRHYPPRLHLQMRLTMNILKMNIYSLIMEVRNCSKLSLTENMDNNLRAIKCEYICCSFMVIKDHQHAISMLRNFKAMFLSLLDHCFKSYLGRNFGVNEL